MTTMTTTSTTSTTSTTTMTITTTTRTTGTSPAAEPPSRRGPPRHLHVIFTTAPLRGAGPTARRRVLCARPAVVAAAPPDPRVVRGEPMSFIEAVVLGLVQALTEFLPISSSAHVRVVGELMDPGQDPGAAFTAIIQLGTETAVLIYFWDDISRIIGKWFRALAGKIPHSDPDVRMGWLVIVGSIPIGVLGLLFEEQIDYSLRNLYITSAMLVLFGLLLGLADRIAPQRKELTQLSVRDGILFGFAQALALIPGVSRSGGTITAGALPDGDRGLDRGGVRRGLCRDRLVHADHREPLVPDVRRLPRRRGPGAAGPALVRRGRPAGRGLSRSPSADRMIDGCIPGPHLL